MRQGLHEALPELKDIAQGDGRLMDGAEVALAAIKDLGALGEDTPAKPAE